MQFRDYFGKVVGRCREKVRMKEGLDCDSRVLRMRYSSQDWVSHTNTGPAYWGFHSQASACTTPVPELLVREPILHLLGL